VPQRHTAAASNADAVISTLNPIIRGWSAYYRTAVSSRAFAQLDTYMWKLTYKWAKHSHANNMVNRRARRIVIDGEPRPRRPGRADGPASVAD
jgi:Group II intron, maturase-specific domain